LSPTIKLECLFFLSLLLLRCFIQKPVRVLSTLFRGLFEASSGIQVMTLYLIVRLAANAAMGKLPILGVANAYIAIAEGYKNGVFVAWQAKIALRFF
jgi:hypothetical protein